MTMSCLAAAPSPPSPPPPCIGPPPPFCTGSTRIIHSLAARASRPPLLGAQLTSSTTTGLMAGGRVQCCGEVYSSRLKSARHAELTSLLQWQILRNYFNSANDSLTNQTYYEFALASCSRGATLILPRDGGRILNPG